MHIINFIIFRNKFYNNEKWIKKYIIDDDLIINKQLIKKNLILKLIWEIYLKL